MTEINSFYCMKGMKPKIGVSFILQDSSHKYEPGESMALHYGRSMYVVVGWAATGQVK